MESYWTYNTRNLYKTIINASETKDKVCFIFVGFDKAFDVMKPYSPN